MSIYHNDIETLKLRDNANVCHDDAAEMFGCYGWHTTTGQGDVCLQVVHTAWLADCKTEAEIVDLLLADGAVSDRDDAQEIAAKAMSVWRDMVSVEEALARASSAYDAGNLAACVEALREAGNMESDHGDDPSTDGLASQLLEEVEDVDFSEYTVRISNDPSYYGPDCSESDAERITGQISDLIRGEFPGIVVEIFSGIGSSATTGPDSSVIEEIDTWIQDNWTSAL